MPPWPHPRRPCHLRMSNRSTPASRKGSAASASQSRVERLLIIPHQLPSLTSPSDLSDYALALDKLDQVPLPAADWAPAEGDEASVPRITVEDPYILGGPSRTVEVAEQP